MTVIAWDGETLAADKLSTQYSQKQKVKKIFRLKDGSIAGVSGTAVYGMAIINWLNSDERKHEDYPKNISNNEESFSCVLVITKDKKVFKYEMLPYPIEIETKLCAIGSGQDYAMAAMVCGKTAVEAVLITNDLSSDCGLGVDAISLDD